MIAQLSNTFPLHRQSQESVRDANMEGKDGAYLQNDVPQRTEERKEAPPFDLTIRWGWTESVISRRTAKMIINNKPLQELRKWVQDVFFPEVPLIYQFKIQIIELKADAKFHGFLIWSFRNSFMLLWQL